MLFVEAEVAFSFDFVYHVIFFCVFIFCLLFIILSHDVCVRSFSVMNKLSSLHSEIQQKCGIGGDKAVDI